MMVLQEALSLLNNETDQVDDLSDLFVVYLQGFTQLLSPLISVMLQTLQDRLALVVLGISYQRETLRALPNLLD